MKMRKATWLGLITLLVFLASGVMSSSALAQTGTTLTVDPTPAEARTCSTSTVAIRVADVTNLTAFHLELSFDPAKIEVTAVAPGSFLIGEGDSYLPEITNAIDNSAGTVVWGLAKQGSGGDPNPVTGSGDILVLTIKAKAANASSALTIDGTNSMLVDWPEAQVISFTDTDGTINTRSCAPTDIALSNASVAENQPGNTVVGSLSATDPDAADTSFTYAFADLAGYPDAMYFNISGSSLRTNVPFDFETKSSYTVRLKVTDPWGETYEENFTISVTDVNDAPVLAYIGAKSVNELAALTFTATAADADLPAQTLAFSLADGTSGAVPTGAAIAPSSGAFTWTPTEEQGPGTYTFDVCVSDGALSDCETITVTVNEVNAAPVLSPIGDKDIEELMPFTFTATATDADIPAQTLTFSLAAGTSGSIPEGAEINSTTGVFTWTPTEAQGDGTYTFDVCASDGTLSDCETITIKVYEDLEVTDADLKVGTETVGPYTLIPGSFAAGYTLQLDPLEDWYYFDTDTISSNRPLADGSYPFYLQGTTTEVFTLVVNGTDYFLRDTYANDGTPLRVQGNYALGSYTYVGEVADAFGFKDDVSLTITFVAPFTVTDADLKAGTIIGGPYSLLEGSFSAGFVMRLDPAVAWYYFDTDSISANRPLANGSYPFYLQGTTTEIFTLEVDGTNYWLRDTFKDDDTPLRIQGNYALGTYYYEGLVADAYGYTAPVTIKITLIDGTIPVLEQVTPPEGPVAISPKATFVLTVDALDNNLFKLEVDHSMESTLPEFSVYADAGNPYGSPEDAAQFAAMGVSVSYNAALQKWTIDFGETVTDAFITNGGITFYLVLEDLEGNQWGTMYGTTPENTFAYTLTVTNTLEEEIASAPLYAYDDGYVYVGDSVFEDSTNTYTNTYSPAEFLAGDGMNDLARYLGALYRQSTSTVTSLLFNGVTYTWDTTGTLIGSNWEDAGGNTLVSAMTAYYFSSSYNPADGMTITLNDGWHTATVTFKLLITNTLEAEIASAVTYEYVPPYAWSGDVTFTDSSNLFTATYSPAEFLAGGPMNDLARYLGALYRQSTSTIIKITYDAVDYTWDTTGTLKGSNWEDASGTTLVSVMVADYLASPADLIITVADGVHTSTVTFRLLITNTLDDEIESAPTYIYGDAFSYTGSYVFDDATNIYTVTYNDVEFNPYAMYDMARYLGALYRQTGATVTSIVYNGVTYTWDSAGTLVGSNWEDASGNTLVSAVVAGIGSYNPAVGLVFTLSDGIHTENVTFKFVILDTIAPELTITGATADGLAMGGDLANGYILVTGNDPMLDRLVQFADGTVSSEPLEDSYFGLHFVEAESTVTAAELKAYYDARGVPEPYLAFLKGAADGINPFVYIKGTTVKLVDAAKHAIAGSDVDMTIPDNFPLGTYTVRGVIKDAAGNETTVTLKLIVVRSLMVTEADLKFAYLPTGPYSALAGSLTSGFEMYLDPSVDWYYLDTDNIVTNNPLADGSYPFYLSPDTTSPIFYVKVEGTTYTLIDAYQGDPNPLRINGDFAPGTYTYTGQLTDVYGSSAAVSIEITFNDALAFLQANTVLSSVSGTIADLKATFPESIPSVIVAEPYVIDSRMTLAQALPVGTTVTVFRGGVEILSDITLSGTGPFWFTELFDPDAPRAAFDAGYGGAVEDYVITLDGSVAFDFATTLKVESVISKDGFTTETVLDDITLDAAIPADEAAALAYLQANTVLSSVSGTIADLKATFPVSIPPVIVDLPYFIDSRMTLAQALPVGTTVTVFRGGVEILSDITLSGTGPFWFTELFDPDAPRSAFDAGYGGAVEDYVITLDGSVAFDFATTLKVESVISKDGFTTETVLDDITLDAAIPANEAAALAYLQANTVLSSVSGTIADLKATFPVSIPPVIVDLPYFIDSRMTLAQALPVGTTVTVFRGGVEILSDITLSGTGPFWFTELFDPDAPRAAFDAGYGGAVEDYVIVVTGPGTNPADFDTTLTVESVISKDGFVTETVLDDIDLAVHIDDAVAPAIASAIAKSASHGDVNLIDGKFTIVQGYVVDEIQVTMSEPVLVDLGTIITMDGVGPYGTVTAHSGALITITPYAGNETAALTGTFTFSAPAGAVTDLRGNAFVGNITLEVWAALDVTNLDLLNATATSGPWTAVPGSYAAGFVMQLDPLVEYYYLDTNSITSNRPLADGLHPFFIESYPADFFTYWAAEGVVSGATGWQGQMWQIINGNAPFFYLKVEGTNYTLIDGLQYAMGNTNAVLRINGSYLLGDYSFSGEVEDALGFSDTLDVDISFVGLLALTDAQLQYSLNQSAWTDMDGSLAAGFSMLLDTSVEYYYLNAPAVTVNRPLAEGLHPFYVESYPADFFTYWAAKGVVDGATGWQGVMWDIISGDAPIFYLKVSAGPTYQLVDGLTYLFGGVESYLKINGSYLPGEYSFSGTVTDAYGYTDDASVDILFNDIPVAQAQSVSTAEDTAVAITLGAVDLYPGPLTWEIVSQPAHGTLSGTAPNMTYTPALNYVGTDSFTFRVNDGTSNSNTATVTITVTGVNDAPVLDPIGDRSADEGVEMSFTATGTDVEGAELSYSLADGTSGEVPEGASIDPATGVFTWTPTEEQGPGTYTFDVCVSDGAITVCETITVTVGEVNVAPVLGAIGDKSVAELVELSFTAGATDADLPANTLTYSLINAPTGAAINPATGAFTWTPTEAQGAGEYTFTVKVCDNGTPSLCDEETITVTVTEVNLAPVLATIGDKSVAEEILLSFTAAATDADLPANTLTYSLVGAPAGAAIDPATGVFTWTPTEPQGAGEYSFTVKVCDNGTPGLCDDEEITVTVSEVNLAPLAVDDAYGTLKNQVLNVSAPGVLGNDSDADLPANTLTAVLVADIPAGEGTLVLASSGAFSYTPPAGFTGATSFTYKVYDGALYSGVATVTITVSDSNLAPTDIMLTDQTILENLPVGSVTAYLSALDPNVGDTFTYSLVNGTGDTDNAAFSISGNQLLSAEVFDYETKDSYSVRIRVTDQGGLWYEESFVITVLDVNDAPVANEQTVSTPEDTALAITLTGSDQDGDALTYAVIANPTHGVLTGTAPNLTYTPASNYHGPDSFTFQASDDYLVSNIATVTINVLPVNDAPVLGAIGDKSVAELVQLSFTATASDLDVPAEDLTFSLVGAPAGAAIDPATGAFTWTPTEAQGAGEYTFTVKVCDNGDPVLCDEEEITVTVTEVNVAPVLGAIGDKSVAELVELSFTAGATDADLPANTLTYSLINAPTGAAINSATGAFTWTPTEAQGAGEYSFTVKVCDNGTPSLCDEEEITVTVTEVNVAPVLGAIGDKTVAEETELSFTAAATDADLPANTLTYSLINAPTGAAINPATGAFTWTPTEAQGPGEYSFTVKVYDNGDPVLCDEEEITVTVTEVNVAPVLGAIGDKSVAEQTQLSFTAAATDADLPANTLTYSLVGAPTGADIDPSTGAFTWTPTEAQGPGEYTFTVKVCDNGTPSLCDEEEITVTVTEVNVAPVLGAIGDKSIAEQTQLSFTAAGTDADLPANTLTFSLVGAPTGAAIDPSTGAFTWTPTEAQGAGEYTFTVKVCDNGTPSLCDDEEITVTVTEVNVAPVLGAIGDKSVAEETELSFTAAATDADLPANTLTFSLVGAPTGAAIDPATGAFTWTPTEAQGAGEYTFTVKVCDNGDPVLCDEEEITVTVTEVNVAPVLGAIGDKTVAEETLLSFTAAATDADLPANTLTYILVGAPAGAAIDPSTGAFTWTPTEAQGAGEYTFTVKVCDNGDPVLCDEEEITVTVTEVNVAPVLGAIGDKTVAEETELSFTAAATDADLPANTLTFSLVGAPTGAAIDPATGAFTWTPTEAQGPGEYTFTVKVCDNGDPILCDEEEITVTVTEVNTAPSAQDQTVTTPEDTPIDITLVASDPEEDPLTVIIVDQPLHGDLTVNGLVVTYTPDLNYYGADSFTYKVNDGLVDSNTATVTLTVTPVNDPPVAYGMTVETLENFAVDIELLATDPEEDTGTFIIVSGPSHGTLDCDGRYCNYTPDPNWNGEDSFVYKVNDGQLDSNEALVTIIVHEGPRIYIPILFK